VTEIREPEFALDLPGEWEPFEAAEDEAVAYRETQGDGVVTVLLVGVRPVYAISDPKRLVDDYMQHRAKFETGKTPSLVNAEGESRRVGDAIEGGWDAVDSVTGRRVRHRVVLASNALADFRYEEPGADEAAFLEQADAILGSAQFLIK
jgi:hypothetical protein